MNNPSWNIRQTDWKNDQLSIKSVRENVFVIEQSIPEELEWDEHDKTARHLLAIDTDAHPIGTARLTMLGEQSQIGRLAVLKNWRGIGIGRSLLEEMVRLAIEEKLSSISLNAQVRVMSFYKSFGFSSVGNEFLEADIPHQKMVKLLQINT